MKTPNVYLMNLNVGIITEQMLADSLYSVSKRAKHHRDKAHQYHIAEANRHLNNWYYYSKYDNEEQSRKKMEFYYSQKDKLLKLLEPTAIHTSTHYRTIRIYKYQETYEMELNNAEIIGSGEEEMFHYEGEIEYYDKEAHDYIFAYQHRYIRTNEDAKIDRADYLFTERPSIVKMPYIVKKEPICQDIYLYYECGGHSFHSPISMGINLESIARQKLDELTKEYPHLSVTEIPDLFVESEDLNDILSSQFTTKVVALIESGNFEFKKDA